jgi:glutathione S-transferase
MKLYGSLTSPYVRKARVLLREKNIPCEFVVAGAADPGSPVPALNPLGKVPVLQPDNGEALFDSPVIVEYLDALSPPAWLPVAGEARWAVLRLEALADGIMDAVVARLLETRKAPAQQAADFIRSQEAKVARSLEYAERQLGNKSWFVSDRFGLADLAVGVALEYIDFRYAHDWRGGHPRLAQWLAGVGARPSFLETRAPGGK